MTHTTHTTQISSTTQVIQAAHQETQFDSILNLHNGGLKSEDVSKLVAGFWFQPAMYSPSMYVLNSTNPSAISSLEAYCGAISALENGEFRLAEIISKRYASILGKWHLRLLAEAEFAAGRLTANKLDAVFHPISSHDSITQSIFYRLQALCLLQDQASFSIDKSKVLMEKALNLAESGSFFEVGRCYLLLASDLESSYDISIRYAEKAIQQFEKCGAAFLIEKAKRIISNRKKLILCRRNTQSRHDDLARLLNPILNAKTIDELVRSVAFALTSRQLFGIEKVFILEKTTDGEKIIYPVASTKDINVGSTDKTCAHSFGSIYRVITSGEVDQNIVRWFLMAAEKELTRISVQKVTKYEQKIGTLGYYSPKLEEMVGRLKLATKLKKDKVVLLLGEAGVGKSRVAEMVHSESGNKHYPFVTFNCAGQIDENLTWKNLFGAKKGSYTGITHDTPGKIVEVGHGTLFIDEIGDLPPRLQSLLLRVLEERVVEPLGAEQKDLVRVECRIIAATNKDLPSMVKEGKFRFDLFNRMAISIRIPSLREVPEQIVPQAIAMLSPLSSTLSEEAARYIESFPWPGNSRQLRHILELAEELSRDRSTIRNGFKVIGMNEIKEAFALNTHMDIYRQTGKLPSARFLPAKSLERITSINEVQFNKTKSNSTGESGENQHEWLLHAIYGTIDINELLAEFYDLFRTLLDRIESRAIVYDRSMLTRLSEAYNAYRNPKLNGEYRLPSNGLMNEFLRKTLNVYPNWATELHRIKWLYLAIKTSRLRQQIETEALE